MSNLDGGPEAAGKGLKWTGHLRTYGRKCAAGHRSGFGGSACKEQHEGS